MVRHGRKFIQAKTARVQAEAGAEGRGRGRGRGRESGAWRSEEQRSGEGERRQSRPHTASPMVLRCIVGE